MGSQIHCFHVYDAVAYGIGEAAFIYRLEYLINNNCIKNKDYVFRDGKYWSFSPRKEITKIMPYLTENQLYRITKKLKKMNVIETRQNPESKYLETTLWYSFTDKEYQERIVLNNKIEKENDNLLKSSVFENDETDPVIKKQRVGSRETTKPDLQTTKPSYKIKNINKENKSAKSEQERQDELLEKENAASELSDKKVSNESVELDQKQELIKNTKQPKREKETLDYSKAYDSLRKHWNEHDSLPKEIRNDTGLALKRFIKLLRELEESNNTLSDLQKCVYLYSKTKESSKTWVKREYSFKRFFGLNGSEPFFERFLPDNYNEKDYMRELDKRSKVLNNDYLKNVKIKNGKFTIGD